MLDLVIVDGQARGIITRDLESGKIERFAADAVCLATGGYSTVFFLSTNAKNCNVTATWRAYKRGRAVRQPLLHADPPHLHPAERRSPVKLTLMSESLRNDGRVWVPKKQGRQAGAGRDPRGRARLLPGAQVPLFGNLAPRDIASARQGAVWTPGTGVGPSAGVYLDFADAIKRDWRARRSESKRYGNLFQMYHEITGENAYETPMRIYPAPHYTMGGLWVDYNLMSTIPGLFVLGEANFSDHGANRLGASALMQGLADGYFVAPYTIGGYIAGTKLAKVGTEHAAFADAESRSTARGKLLAASRQADGRRLPPRARQAHVGQVRHGPQRGRPQGAAARRSRRSATSSGPTCKVTGSASEFNQNLERPAAWPTTSSSPR
jgi:succinate dehydrogenase / fumarate reductase flavoprotein subunit